MWSEQPPPAQCEQMVRAIRSTLPEPSSGATRSTIPLAAQPAPEQVAHLLHRESGFVWLDGDSTRHLIFRDPLAVISCDGAQATVRGPGGVARFPASSLDLLQAALQAWNGPGGGTLAGFIAYDVAAELENLGSARAEDAPVPRLHFGLYDSALIADSNGWSLTGSDAWRGRNGLPISAVNEEKLLQSAMASSLPPLDAAKLSAGPLFARPDPASFLNGVDRIVSRIHNGDFFQTNFCRHLEAPLRSDLAWPLYRRMRKLSPPEFGAFLQWDEGRALLSISPELFLKVRDGNVESRPIKGTRKRGRTEEEDRILKADLLESCKDGAELAMIVDVSRNDLSRVCVAGSVQVVEHATLLTLPTLHHTFSRVTGQLRRGKTVTDLLRASFPAASITGAPKIAAMQAALEEEGHARGPCMGSIGWISLDGQLELSVAIRTAFTNAGVVSYLAGCGITADSIALEELEESRTKASAFVTALGLPNESIELHA